MPLPVEVMGFFLVGLFVVGDLSTTALALTRWFDAEEGNPVGAYIIYEYGVLPFFAVSVFSKTLFAVWAFDMWIHAAVWSHRLLADLLAALGLLLTLHNLNVLRQTFSPR